MKTPESIEKYDKLTKAIWRVLRCVGLGSIYMKAPMIFNYMIVGATGVFLNWMIYEGIFRPIFVVIPTIGTLIGVAVTTVVVFLWNFFWNKKWSLNFRSQILTLSQKDLKQAYDMIGGMIDDKPGLQPDEKAPG